MTGALQPLVGAPPALMERAVDAAASAARLAQRGWAETPTARRLDCVRRLRQLIARHAERLAWASASTRGRPVSEVLTAEVAPLAESCRFLERHATRLLAPSPWAAVGCPCGFPVSGRRSAGSRLVWF